MRQQPHDNPKWRYATEYPVVPAYAEICQGIIRHHRRCSVHTVHAHFEISFVSNVSHNLLDRIDRNGIFEADDSA